MDSIYVRFFVNSEIFASNVYLLTSNKWTILVDPSFYDNEEKEALKKEIKLNWILITHWHWDHIRCIDNIIEDFPWTNVYIHKDDHKLLLNPDLNCSRRVWKDDIIIKSNCTDIDEWNLQIGWYNIQVFHFQWHTYWSVMYYFEDENIMFMWDTIMCDTIWTTRVPTWNIDLLKNSIKKFMNLNIKDCTLCYPWHWEATTFAEIKKHNPFLNGEFKI